MTSRSGCSSTAQTEKMLTKLENFFSYTATRPLIKHHKLVLYLRVRFKEFQGSIWEFAAKFVPRTLTNKQTKCSDEACRALKEQLETDPDFLLRSLCYR